MASIISVPLFFENREWQTIVMIYPQNDQFMACVHILNDRLARKLASQNMFLITADGKVKIIDTNGIVQPTTEFRVIVQNALRSFLARHTEVRSIKQVLLSDT